MMRQTTSSSSHIVPSAPDLPPTYEEAIGSSSSQFHSRTSSNDESNENNDRTIHLYRERVSSMASQLHLQSSHAIPNDAQVIFQLDDVQLFYVSPEGLITAPSYPTRLTICKFDSTNPNIINLPSGWLQVDSWIYPLIPSYSPVLQTNYGAFIFPDSEKQGAAIGLLVPCDIKTEVLETFENILRELTAVKDSEIRLSEKIANGIIKGAVLVAKGFDRGAGITSLLVHEGGSSLRDQINTTNSPDVDPRVQKGFYYVWAVTSVAVSISSFIVQKIIAATIALSKQMAPHLRREGTALISKALGEDEKNVNRKVDDVLEVTSGIFTGFATIYASLENAARLLASSLMDETIHIVNKRYGYEVSNENDEHWEILEP